MKTCASWASEWGNNFGPFRTFFLTLKEQVKKTEIINRWQILFYLFYVAVINLN